MASGQAVNARSLYFNSRVAGDGFSARVLCAENRFDFCGFVSRNRTDAPFQQTSANKGGLISAVFA